jgi:hypothetical protein
MEPLFLHMVDRYQFAYLNILCLTHSEVSTSQLSHKTV